MSLRDLIDGELRRTLPPAVVHQAALLAGRAPGHVVAVLFYGSALRTGALDGILDYYVLLDELRAWPASWLARLANRVLPPNVAYLESPVEGCILRAKYAVLSMPQFSRRMAATSRDTTLWARFSQPCACAFVRSDADRGAVAEVLCKAARTAAQWAAWLGPARDTAAGFWRALYARTYDAELRVESAMRGPDLVDRESTRYARLLPAAWEMSGIAFDATADGLLAPRLDPRQRRRAARRWSRRRGFGRLLNLLRLVKSAFTFDGAMDYVAWKIERHSGVRLALSPWQRRHPVLAAPGLYWRLRKLGLLR